MKIIKKGFIELIKIVLTVAIISTFLLGIDYFCPMVIPQVYWSVSEDVCVGIAYKGERLSPSELHRFKKYERIWVK